MQSNYQIEWITFYLFIKVVRWAKSHKQKFPNVVDIYFLCYRKKNINKYVKTQGSNHKPSVIKNN